MPSIKNITDHALSVPRGMGAHVTVDPGELLEVSADEVKSYTRQTEVWELSEPKTRTKPAAKQED